MFDKNLFMGAIVSKGFTLKKLADNLDMNTATLSRKVNGHASFTNLEISAIAKFVGLKNEQILEIFFADNIT